MQYTRIRDEDSGKEVDEVSLQSLDEEEGNEFKVDFKQMKRIARVQHAWARTINTFQVSLHHNYLHYKVISLVRGHLKALVNIVQT